MTTSINEHDDDSLTVVREQCMQYERIFQTLEATCSYS